MYGTTMVMFFLLVLLSCELLLLLELLWLAGVDKLLVPLVKGPIWRLALL